MYGGAGRSNPQVGWDGGTAWAQLNKAQMATIIFEANL